MCSDYLYNTVFQPSPTQGTLTFDIRRISSKLVPHFVPRVTLPQLHSTHVRDPVFFHFYNPSCHSWSHFSMLSLCINRVTLVQSPSLNFGLQWTKLAANASGVIPLHAPHLHGPVRSNIRGVTPSGVCCKIPHCPL